MTSKTSNLKKGRGGLIELPASPLWGYGLIGVMLAFVAIGLYLILGSGAGGISIPGGGCIGLVEINGEILAQETPDSLFSTGVMGSEEIAKEIEKADERSDVKAILIQINSPGGSVVGSHEIYTAVKNTKKPTVAYFREVAASGGYYAAAGADYIISEPDALTGSIGARMTFTELSGLFEKIGYNETTIKSGEFKDIGSYSRKMSKKEKEILNSIIQEAYSGFEQDVIDGRGDKLNMRLFRQNATDARVLTGRQAKVIGLVDEVGSKKYAIEYTSKLAGFDQPLEVCKITEKSPGFLSQLFSGKLDFSSLVQRPRASLEYR